MGSHGSKIFKTLLLPQITLEYFETSELSSQKTSQKYCFGFWNFEFPIFNDFFFENFKFTIVAYREIKNSIVWKKKTIAEQNWVKFGTHG